MEGLANVLEEIVASFTYRDATAHASKQAIAIESHSEPTSCEEIDASGLLMANQNTCGTILQGDYCIKWRLIIS